MNKQRKRAPKGFKKGYMADFLRKRVTPMHHKGRPRKSPLELSPSAVRILRWLRQHADETGKWVGRPSTIAPRAHYDPRTIRRAIEKFEQLGLAYRAQVNGTGWAIVLTEHSSPTAVDSKADKKTDAKILPCPEAGRETLQKSTDQNAVNIPVPPRPSFIGQKNTAQVLTFPPQKIPSVSTPSPITVGGVPQNVLQRLVPDRPAWSARKVHIYIDPVTGRRYYRHDNGKFVLMH